jgi:hypothetical protein
MFFQLGRVVTHYRWLIVGVWMVAIGIALPFAPQATQVLLQQQMKALTTLKGGGDSVGIDFNSVYADQLVEMDQYEQA